MGKLSTLFNRLANRPVTLSRDTLAGIAAPFLPAKNKSPDMKDIARGWQVIGEWLAIGFDMEQEKGASFKALEHAMKNISSVLDRAPAEALSVDVPRAALGILRSTVFQMIQAADHLDSFSHMRKAPEIYTTQGSDGIAEVRYNFTNTIPMWDRPGENHAAMARKLRIVHDRLEAALGQTGVRAASLRTVEGYLPPRLF